jgi:hypothetical protein
MSSHVRSLRDALTGFCGLQIQTFERVDEVLQTKGLCGLELINNRRRQHGAKVLVNPCIRSPVDELALAE